jgi:hypothetical protein
MLVIVGLAVLLIAVIVAVIGLGSTGTLSVFGIVVGAVAFLGLGALLVGTRRVVLRAHDARRASARFERETAFINRDGEGRHGYEQRARGRSR